MSVACAPEGARHDLTDTQRLRAGLMSVVAQRLRIDWSEELHDHASGPVAWLTKRLALPKR